MPKQSAPLMFRQGDVALVRIDTLPEDAKPCQVEGDIILAYGEVTGHAHRLAPETVKPFARGGAWDPAAERYIQVLAGRLHDVPVFGERSVPVPYEDGNIVTTERVQIGTSKHEGAVVRHEEHSPIPVPPGLYRVIIQREYSPAGLRNVAD